MTTLGERVARAINESGVTAKTVAEACNISVQAVYAWKRGDVKDLRNENLFCLADVTGFEARWIGTGAGPETSPPDPKEKALVALYRSSNESAKDAIMGVAEKLAPYTVDASTPAKDAA